MLETHLLFTSGSAWESAGSIVVAGTSLRDTNSELHVEKHTFSILVTNKPANY